MSLISEWMIIFCFVPYSMRNVFLIHTYFAFEEKNYLTNLSLYNCL